MFSFISRQDAYTISALVSILLVARIISTKKPDINTRIHVIVLTIASMYCISQA